MFILLADMAVEQASLICLMDTRYMSLWKSTRPNLIFKVVLPRCIKYLPQGAPVTGLSAHHGIGPVDFSQLFLTSSIDWTIKLWSLKESKPLYSFEDNGDYVYDVAWSPIHPALFASVDGNG